jgi:hypothetical protein
MFGVDVDALMLMLMIMPIAGQTNTNPSGIPGSLARGQKFHQD